MGQIVVLKNITKVNQNTNNTLRINIATFAWEPGAKEVLQRKRRQGPSYSIKCWFSSNNKYQEKIESEWKEIFAPTSNGIASAINSILSVTGLGSLQTKSMYTQIWTGTKPIEFTFQDLTFLAETSATTDVMVPIRLLQQISLPGEFNTKDSSKNNAMTRSDWWNALTDRNKANKLNNVYNSVANVLWRSVLTPPVSSVINLSKEIKQGETFLAIDSIEIGNFITLRDIILEDVGVVWDINSVDYAGVPLEAKVELKIKSRTVWTSQTIQNLAQGREDIPRTDSDGNQLPTVLDIGKLGKDAWNIMFGKS